MGDPGVLPRNNDPCRAKGRLNTDLRGTLFVPDSGTPTPRSTPRRSIPNIPALDNRLSGSTSSLSSVGKSSTKGKAAQSADPSASGLASKRSTNMAKSCSNLSTAGGSTSKASASSEAARTPMSAPRKPPTPSSAHSTPRTVRSGASSSSRLNGTGATGRVTPTPSGTRTPTTSKTPTGSRSGSPTLNRRPPASGERSSKPSNVKQNMRF